MELVPLSFPIKSKSNYVIVEASNYSNQLIIYKHPDHGEVFSYTDKNNGTRFPDSFLGMARFYASKNNGLIIEVTDDEQIK